MRSWWWALGVSAIAVASVGMGCSKPYEPKPGPDQGQDHARPGGIAPGDYSKILVEGPLGTMELSSLLPEAYARRRSRLAQESLRKLDLGGDFNTEVFALDGYETPGAVLARPRILLRSSVTGERELVREAPGGLRVASVSVALIDGLASQINTGKGARSVPEGFLVTHRPDFLMAVEKVLAKKPNFLAAVNCPEVMQLRVEGAGQFPVIFKSKLHNCPLNTFFPAEISFKREEWDDLLVAFVEGRAVAVEAKLNLATPLTLDYAQFSLSRAAVRGVVRGLLNGKPEPYSASQVASTGSELVALLQEQFHVSLPPERFTSFVDGVIHDFLKVAAPPVCPDGLKVCFLLNSEATEEGRYRFSVKREEFVGRPLLIEATAPVNDYLSDRQEFALRAEGDSPLAPPRSSTLSGLFRTVQEGDVLEFEVKGLQLGRVTFPEGSHHLNSHLVCTDPYSNCTAGDWKCLDSSPVPYNCKRIDSGWVDRPTKCQIECPTSYGLYFQFWKTDPGHDCTQCRPDNCAAAMLVNPIEPCQPYWYSKTPTRVVETTRVSTTWQDVCDEKRVCEFVPYPGPAPSMPRRIGRDEPLRDRYWEWVCTGISQDQCDPEKLEDHWERVSTWSLPSMTPEFQPMSWRAEYWKQVLAGLSFQFSSATEQGTGSTVCTLGSMSYRLVDANKLIVQFKNTAACAPFNELNKMPGYGPTLGLLNQVAFATDFQCGSLVENWEGKRRYVCRYPDGTETVLDTTAAADQERLNRGEPLGIHKVYYPRVELQGSLRLVGSYFESLESKQGDGK